MLVTLLYCHFNLTVSSQVAILNISALTGWIMLADYFGVYNGGISCTLSSMVLIFAITAIRTVTGMIFFAILYRFMSGTSMYYVSW